MLSNDDEKNEFSSGQDLNWWQERKRLLAEKKHCVAKRHLVWWLKRSRIICRVL
jgi:hypothetical protein